MAYALFAQKKVQLTGQLNSLTLQQSQRSNEQFLLASNTLSLQQQLASIQSAQALELADLYAVLSNAPGDDGQHSNYKEFKKSDDYSNLSSAAKSLVDNNRNRDAVNAEIKKAEAMFEAELSDINRQIYLVGIKENSIEMQVKRLDSMVSSIQKQLEAIGEAEGSGIDRSTPKFNGVG